MTSNPDILDMVNATLTGEPPVSAETPAETPPAETPATTPETPAETEPEKPAESPADTESPAAKKGAAALIDEPEGEKKADEPPKTDAAVPEGLTEKAKYKWGELRAEAEQVPILKSKVTALETELASARKLGDADPLKKEIETLKAQLEETKTSLAKADIRKAPEFIKEITEPIKLKQSALEAITKGAEIPFSKIRDAIYMPQDKYDAAMSEIIETLTPVQQQRVTRLADEWRDLEIRGFEMEDNAKPALEESAARQKEAAEKAGIERKASQMRGITEMADKMGSTFKLLVKEGGPEADAIKKSILEVALSTPFDEMQPEDQQAATLALATIPSLKKAAMEKDELIASLRRQLSGTARAAPTTANASPVSSTPDEIPDSPEAFTRATFAQR
jgi:hypothetical protein